jgi:hypothetical protein
MSIFTIFTRSPYWEASSEMIGAIARHGPHHSAQKSMIVGLSASSTSVWKFWSVTSCTFDMPLLLLFLEDRLSGRSAFGCRVAGPGYAFPTPS